MDQIQIVLYSGGPDSLITLRFVQKTLPPAGKILPLYFNLGHRYAEHELYAIEQTVPETLVSNELGGLGLIEEKDAHIWHRNAYLTLAATRFIGPQFHYGLIWLTVQKDELGIPDRTPKFMDTMGSVLESLSSTDQLIKVASPWLKLDKTDMVKHYLAQGFGADELKKTFSCYQPLELPGKHCGDCAACIRRYIAFSLNGIEEDYPQDPTKSPTAEHYRQAALAGKYSAERNKRILDALGR